MKKTTFYVRSIAIALSLTMVVPSCKKKDTTPETNNPSTPVITTPFTALVNGTEFVETSITGTVSTWTQTLEIKAVKGSQSISVKIPKSTTPGTYTFQDPDIGTFAAYYNDGNDTFGAETGTGSLVIVSNKQPTISTQGEIKGTFSFIAKPYSFTNGSSANYTISSGQFIVNYN